MSIFADYVKALFSIPPYFQSNNCELNSHLNLSGKNFIFLRAQSTATECYFYTLCRNRYFLFARDILLITCYLLKLSLFYVSIIVRKCRDMNSIYL